MNRNNFKNYLHYPFRVPSDPPPRVPEGVGGAIGAGGAMGAEPYTKKSHISCQFWGFQEWKFQNNLHFSLRVPSGISSQGTRGPLRTKPPSLPQGSHIDESEATLKGK